MKRRIQGRGRKLDMFKRRVALALRRHGHKLVTIAKRLKVSTARASQLLQPLTWRQRRRRKRYG